MRFSHDRHPAAAGMSRTLGADVPAVAVRLGPGDQRRVAPAAAQQPGQEIAADGPASGPGALVEDRPEPRCLLGRDDRLPLPGATISPRCSRWPERRAAYSIRRIVSTVHACRPLSRMPRVFQSVAIARTLSPARTRPAASRTSTASAGSTVTRRVDSRTAGCRRRSADLAAARSSFLRLIRRLASSEDLRATAPRIRAWNRPSWLPRLMSPSTVPGRSVRRRRTTSKKASSSRGWRCSRSRL